MFCNDTRRDHFTTMLSQPLESHRYIDWDVMDRIGLTPSLHQFFANIGWEHFARISVATYEPMTREIISSLNKETIQGEKYITFCWLNIERRLTYANLATLIGYHVIPPQSSYTQTPFVDKDAWTELTGLPEIYHTRTAKASSIPNLARRLLRKFIVFNFFAHHDNQNSVQQEDLEALWHLTKDRAFVLVLIIATRLQSYKSPRNKIHLRWICTIIAESFGPIPPPQLTTVVASSNLSLIDEYFLSQIHVLHPSSSSEHLVLTNAARRSIDLPEAESENEGEPADAPPPPFHAASTIHITAEDVEAIRE